MCLHSDGEIHIELAGKNPRSESPCCDNSEYLVGNYDCISCTDILLQVADLGPIRLNELASVDLPTLNVSEAQFDLVAMGHPPKPESESWNRTRAPPEVEPTSQQISRTIVLRL